MGDVAVVQWIVGGLSVVAFILLLKLGASYLPDDGILGALKHVVGNI